MIEKHLNAELPFMATENILIERIANDKAFGMTKDEITAAMKPENFIGRAPQQTEELVEEFVKPIIEKYKDELGIKAEVNV